MTKAVTPRVETLEKQAEFLAARAALGDDALACEDIGITAGQLETWRSRYPGFRLRHEQVSDDQVDEARQAARKLLPKVVQTLELLLDADDREPQRTHWQAKLKAAELLLRMTGALEGRESRAGALELANRSPKVAIQVVTNVARPYPTGQTVESTCEILP